MKLIQNVQRDENSVVTVGTFDGVHRGHRVLIDQLCERSAELDARSVVVTFDPHPREIIHPNDDGIRLLTTLSERYELLREIGVDEMIVIPFDRDFSLLSSETFLRSYIWDKIGVREFVIGYDHQFGKDRKGTISTVKRVSRELGFSVRIVSRQDVGSQAVSSTRIREALRDSGDVSLASRLLDRPYRLHGRVIHGDKRGREIGFPTANVEAESDRKLIPANGVYAVWVEFQGKTYGGMMNIGTRPTFSGQGKRMEVHLFDFSADIYGEKVQILFCDRIRDERPFPNPEALEQQLTRDKEEALQRLKLKEKLP
ncbi:MAG: bifunctional riboflavin kinase/FAD synthetase [Bacteroidota bacterium]